MFNKTTILAALEQLTPQWTATELATIQPAIAALRNNLKPHQDESLLQDLIMAIETYPPRYAELKQLLKRQALNLAPVETQLAQTYGVTVETVAHVLNQLLPVIQITEVEPEKQLVLSLSAKRQAIRINWPKLSGIVTTLLATSVESQGALIAAGIFAMFANESINPMSRLSLDETSVLLGIILACDNFATPETKILAFTNQTRQKWQLNLLDGNQIKPTLEKLSALKIIEPTTDGQWQLLENYTFVG